MKYIPLIWAGLWRKPVRATFTALSIVVAFLLFGLVQGINQGMEFAFRSLHADRLYVMNRISSTRPQPIAHMTRMQTLPSVRSIVHWTYLGGYFKNPRNQIPVIATNLEEMFALYPELVVPPEQLAQVSKVRTGAIIGKRLAEQHGLKVGDRVPIVTPMWTQKDGSKTWYFDVVGIFESSTTTPVYGNGLFVNYDYFDAARASGNGSVHLYIVGIDDPQNSERVSREIDALFANSRAETRTRNEQAYARIQINQLADISLIANAVVGAALFTLLFVSGNTMMQSMRERIPEFAVFKSLGFTDATIMLLVLGEALVLCLLAALIGLGLAVLIFPSIAAIFGSIKLPSLTLVLGVVMALLVALISGFPPAWRVKRLSVVDALAGR